MITHMHNHPRLITQTTDNECEIPEPAIGVSQDSSGLIVLVQEGREILIDKSTVNDLCKALREQTRLLPGERGE